MSTWQTGGLENWKTGGLELENMWSRTGKQVVYLESGGVPEN